MNNQVRNLIQNLLKTADMPNLPGQGHVNQRDLHWIRFDRNSLTQNLSTLPNPVKTALSKKLDEFNREFAQFPAGQKSKYSGMLWVLYADDRSITDDVLNGLAKEGGEIGRRLMETAQFAQKNALQLPSMGASGQTRGRQVDKGIGSDYWLSMFGYAYQGLPGYNVLRKKNDIPRKVVPNAGNRESKYPNGPLAISQWGNGFRLVVSTQNGEVPAYEGQSVINFAKFFKGENLFVNKSVVYVPPSGQNQIVPDHLAESSQPNMEGPIFQIANQQAAMMIKENEAQRKFIWGVFIDDDGVFFLQQRLTFGGGRGGTKLTGERRPMTQEQVESIVNQDRMNVNHIVFPQQSDFSEEELSANDIVTGTKFVYIMDDETKNRIRNPDSKNQLEWAVSAPALSKLKTFLEVRNMEAEKDTHTAFEGFLLYMVGPNFAKAKNLGEGKANSRPLTTDPKYVSVQQPNNESGELVSDRNITWVVLANRISEQRRLANDRNTYLDLWQKVYETDDLQEALDVMVQKAASNGGSIPRISSRAGSVPPASHALEQAREMPAQQKFEPINKQLPQQQPNQQALPQPAPTEPDLSSMAKSLIRRLNTHV